MGSITRRTLSAGLLALPALNSARAQERTVTFAGYSGIFQENYQAAVIDPFMRKHPGIKVNYFSAASSAVTLGMLRGAKGRAAGRRGADGCDAGQGRQRRGPVRHARQG